MQSRTKPASVVPATRALLYFEPSPFCVLAAVTAIVRLHLAIAASGIGSFGSLCLTGVRRPSARAEGLDRCRKVVFEEQ